MSSKYEENWIFLDSTNGFGDYVPEDMIYHSAAFEFTFLLCALIAVLYLSIKSSKLIISPDTNFSIN